MNKLYDTKDSTHIYIVSVQEKNEFNFYIVTSLVALVIFV